MKVNELYGNKQIDLQNAYSLEKITELLKTKGFENIGKGSNAFVYKHPKLNYVLKIFHNDDNGYLNFLNICQHNKNEHFPVFKGKNIKINNRYSASRLELLTPIPSSNKYENYYSSLFREYYAYRSLKKQNTFIDFLKQEDGYNNDTKEHILIIKLFPNLLTAFDILFKNKSLNVRFDLHSDNIMLRNNEIPVIIDPFV